MTVRPAAGAALLLAAAGLLAGCGSAGSASLAGRASPPPTAASTAPAPTTMACSSGRATLTADAQLRVLGCPPGTRTQVTGGAVTRSSPFVFRAAAAGTATVTLAGGPVCSGAAACPQYRTFLGRIEITVR